MRFKNKYYRPRDVSYTIDRIFMDIRDIADSYLSMYYPESEDPDLFVSEIKKLINKYHFLKKGGVVRWTKERKQ